MNIKNLIRAIGTGQTSDASEILDSILADKTAERLELKQIEVASNMFNSTEEV